MRLSTRLLLLILGCMLPILAAQIYTQIKMHSERQHQVGTLALRQADYANNDFAEIVARVAEIAATVAQLPGIAASGASCSEQLASLQRSLPAYRFLAIADSTGRLACASAPALADPAHDRPTWFADLLTDSEAKAGRVSMTPGLDGVFLPIAARLPLLNNVAAPNRYLVVGLDLRWFGRYLAEGKVDPIPLLTKATLILTDQDGVVLAHHPEDDHWIGRPLPDALKSLLSAPQPGITTTVDPDGQVQMTAYLPLSVPPVGIAAIVTLSLSDLAADLERGSAWDLILISAAAATTLLLTWLAGRRFIFQPTETLLRAAHRWRDGDLNARATPSESGSEFAALAQSFNAMAAGLQARDLERRLQAQFLESQVAERTRELSESNNRLQVEIAEREKTEAALHQAQKLQAVGQLAGGIAHDFNNMLATVLGNLELMERRVAQSTEQWTSADAERLARLIERATGAVQRGAQLTSRLLAFSRRQRLAARPTDLNRLITELITLATSTLGRRVRVIPDLAVDLWPALVDPSQVEAAILNLCLNARDAMKDGGQLTISTANELLTEAGQNDDLQPGAYVRVSIADTGIGMTEDVRRRAFDPFFTTKGPSGSGLGLSQVYGMVRQSGGMVRLDSTPGHGTEVSLLLPRATAEAEAEAQAETRRVSTEQEQEPEAPRRHAPAELVLVVDDDHAVRQVTVEMLRDLGCDVVQAQGGTEALALLDGLDSGPQLILLDYAMPGMNGLQLARRLRDRGLTVPTALVTGYAELAESDARASPLDGLLRKPFTIRELQAMLVQLRAIAAERSSVGVATHTIVREAEAAGSASRQR